MIVVENAATQDHFSKISIYNFLGPKNMKKGYMEMTKKIYLEAFEKCPGSLHFPLLKTHLNPVIVQHIRRSSKTLVYFALPHQ